MAGAIVVPAAAANTPDPSPPAKTGTASPSQQPRQKSPTYYTCCAKKVCFLSVDSKFPGTKCLFNNLCKILESVWGNLFGREILARRGSSPRLAGFTAVRHAKPRFTRIHWAVMGQQAKHQLWLEPTRGHLQNLGLNSFLFWFPLILRRSSLLGTIILFFGT